MCSYLNLVMRYKKQIRKFIFSALATFQALSCQMRPVASAFETAHLAHSSGTSVTHKICLFQGPDFSFSIRFVLVHLVHPWDQQLLCLYWSLGFPWALMERRTFLFPLGWRRGPIPCPGSCRAAVSPAWPGFSCGDHPSPSVALGSSKGCPCPSVKGMLVEAPGLCFLLLLLTITTRFFPFM